ncbi:MAG: NYN domain-containing protein [Acidobacteria bacterium]|nr:NYN domain-containing protein [Acidobacteriota bacterium]
MALIVDGNNVMGQKPGWHRDKNRARRDLLDQLAIFARARKTRLTVVFDGSPDQEFPEGAVFRGVKILYAERGSDADSRIIRVVELAKDRRGFTVVTSDRQLAFAVRALGATTMRSGEFRQQLEAAMQAAPTLEDGEKPVIDDVNSWLRYFGATPEDDE